MSKITVQALPTERDMEKLLQSLVDDEESDFPEEIAKASKDPKTPKRTIGTRKDTI